MVNSCAVPGCPTKASDLEVSFHRVPRDPILFEQWNSSIRLDQYGGQLSPTAHVCSIHFRESDFWVSSKGVTFLKRYAVPTVFDMCTNSIEESSTKNVHQKIKSKKGARNSTITSKQKKSPVTSTVKKEMPSTSQSNGNTSSPSKLDGEVCRKNVFIVRGNETFSVVVEKCNTPSSSKRPAEDGDGEWRAKRVCRLPDCNTSRMLIKNAQLYAKVEQNNKVGQSPGCIPSVPAAESVLAKSGVISESAVIPAPGEPASPEEGSIVKEAGGVSVSKEVTPVPSQVRKPHFLCADCKKKKVVLEPFKIGTDFTIFMCPMEECVYPLGEVNLYRFLYKKLPNNSQRPCTRAEAPTLDDIVAVISSSDQ